MRIARDGTQSHAYRPVDGATLMEFTILSKEDGTARATEMAPGQTTRQELADGRDLNRFDVRRALAGRVPLLVLQRNASRSGRRRRRARSGEW